jgi:hypothetical protein
MRKVKIGNEPLSIQATLQTYRYGMDEGAPAGQSGQQKGGNQEMNVRFSALGAQLSARGIVAGRNSRWSLAGCAQRI